MQPLVKHGAQDSPHLDQVTWDALTYIDTMVDVAPPKCVPLLVKRRRVTGWGDAEYDPERPELGAGLGYLIKNDKEWIAAAARATCARAR